MWIQNKRPVGIMNNTTQPTIEISLWANLLRKRYCSYVFINIYSASSHTYLNSIPYANWRHVKIPTSNMHTSKYSLQSRKATKILITKLKPANTVSIIYANFNMVST